MFNFNELFIDTKKTLQNATFCIIIKLIKLAEEIFGIFLGGIEKMKKRVLAAILTLALVASLVAAISIPSYAATMGKTQSKLIGELSEFIKTAESQIPRDDWQNIPGETGEHPLTTELKAKIVEAKALRGEKNVDKMDAFLVDLYGGWVELKDDKDVPTGEYGYGDSNKPFTKFQDTLNIRWGRGNYFKKNYTGVEYSLYYGDKPLSQLKRENYTIESWEEFRKTVDVIEAYMNVTSEYPTTHMSVCTRSEMYKNLQDYYAAYDKLVPFNGDKEVNKYRGYLHDVLFRTYCKPYVEKGWTFEEMYTVMDVKKPADSPEYNAFKNFVESCTNIYNDANATVEQLQGCLDMEPRYTVKTETSSYQITKSEAEKQIAEGKLKEADLVRETDEDGKPTDKYVMKYEYQEKMSGYVQDFRDNIYLGKKYREDKNPIYQKALLEYQNGKSTKENWDIFMKCFEKVDAVINEPLTKESVFVQGIADVRAAYEVLKGTYTDKKQYELAYEQITEWVKEKGELDKIYTAATVETFKTALKTFEDAYASFQKGETLYTEEDLYTFILYIYNAKDGLKLLDDGGDKDDVGLEEVLNQMVVLFDEFTYIKEEFTTMFEDNDVDELQQECFDLFIEAYDAFEKLMNKGLDEIEANKKDANAKITVTTQEIFKALLELYQAQNSLTLQIAAPGTSND